MTVPPSTTGRQTTSPDGWPTYRPPLTVARDATPVTHRVLGLAVGVVGALVGLLPWLVHGPRLPLQNLWAADTLPDDMPWVLLPFNQYYLAALASMLIIGPALLGVGLRLARWRGIEVRVGAVVAGAVLVHGLAITQSAAAVAGGLRGGTMSLIYLAGLVIGSLVASGLGLAALALIARARPSLVVVAGSLAAVASSSWLSRLLLGGLDPGDTPPMAIMIALPWVTPVLVAVVLVWSGVRGAGRVVAALVALLVAVLGPAAVTAVTAATGTRVLASRPAEMVAYAGEVFLAVLTTPVVWLPLAVVPLIGLVVGAALRSGSTRDDRR